MGFYDLIDKREVLNDAPRLDLCADGLLDRGPLRPRNRLRLCGGDIAADNDSLTLRIHAFICTETGQRKEKKKDYGEKRYFVHGIPTSQITNRRRNSLSHQDRVLYT